MPNKEKPLGMTLELLKRDRANLNEVLRHSSSRRKAPVIRSVLQKYAYLLKQQDVAQQRGRRLSLVEIDDGGSQHTVIEHLELDL
jgi:hypothetical protein